MALHLAAHKGHHDCLQILLEGSCDKARSHSFGRVGGRGKRQVSGLKEFSKCWTLGQAWPSRPEKARAQPLFLYLRLQAGPRVNRFLALRLWAAASAPLVRDGSLQCHFLPSDPSQTSQRYLTYSDQQPIQQPRPMQKRRFRNHASKTSFDSATTIQQLPFRNHDSETTSQKPRRFRNHDPETTVQELPRSSVQ